MEELCEVHYYNMADGHCTCAQIQREKERREKAVLQEKFWNEWQAIEKIDKLLWIHDNLPYLVKNMISVVDGDHILQCIESMVASLCGKHPGGEFVEAVLNNDLMTTLDRADDLNQIVLRTYELFLYNKVPYPLRRK